MISVDHYTPLSPSPLLFCFFFAPPSLSVYLFLFILTLAPFLSLSSLARRLLHSPQDVYSWQVRYVVAMSAISPKVRQYEEGCRALVEALQVVPTNQPLLDKAEEYKLVLGTERYEEIEREVRIERSPSLKATLEGEKKKKKGSDGPSSPLSPNTPTSTKGEEEERAGEGEREDGEVVSFTFAVNALLVVLTFFLAVIALQLMRMICRHEKDSSYKTV